MHSLRIVASARRAPLALAALLATAAAAPAQSINIDICPPGFVVPPPGYPGAAAQPGFWNSVNPNVVDVALPLAGLAGGVAVATVEIADGEGGFYFDNLGTLGGDDLLLDDIQDVGPVAATSTYTFDGLASGAYWIYTYAWAPDDMTFETEVDVPISADPPQVVGGPWPGANVYLETFAVHFIVLPPLVDTFELVVTTVTGAGSVNGFQLVYYGEHGCHGDVHPYCTAKTNSAGCVPVIGHLAGPPSAGTCGCPFVITAQNVLDNKSGLLFYSTSGPASAPFFGGTLCAHSPLKRTPVQNSGGTPPCGGGCAYDFNQRIASGVDPALVAGQTVWAQWYTRDPGFLPPNSVGFTNALRFTICF